MVLHAPTAEPLRRNRRFVRYWLASSASGVGSQVTILALPLTAIGVVHASAAQVALLSTATSLPYVLGFLVGPSVGRHRRRSILLAADLGRAAALASLPCSYVLGDLTLAQLYAVGALCGLLSLVFEIASQAFLPSLVPRSRLIDANAAFEAARATAQTAGPAAAGLLVSLIAAPLALLVDAASFVTSACLLLTVRIPDVRTPSLGGSAVARTRAVVAHPYLGPLLVAHALANLSIGLVWSVVLVYGVRTLDLGPAAIGAALGVGQIGAFAGVAFGRRLAARVGVGPSLATAFALFGPATLLIAVAPRREAIVFVVAGWTLDNLARALYGVFAAAVRQAAIPAQLQAHVVGITTTVAMGSFPLGTVLGGTLAAVAGLRSTMLIGAAVSILPCLPVVFSPLVRLHRIDDIETRLSLDRTTAPAD